MRIPYRLLQIIGCLALLLALQACSAIRLAYNQAPDLIYWWMDGYVDFNEVQTPKVREEIAKLFAWHRANELPKLAALLQKAQTQAPGSVSSAQACAMFDEARVLLDNITERALPPMAEFVLTLTPEQLEHLQTKYKKSNEEYQRDFMFGSAAEKAASRLKRAVERSERFYGSLEEAQLTAVKRSIEVSSFDAQRSFAERIRRQGDALQMLRKLIADKASPVQAQTALRAYVQRSINSPDARYREYANKLVQEGCQSFADVHASTTKEQRIKMVETLKGYEGDVRVLAVNK
jgi:Family of unknown function (DUF6279)